MFYSVNDTGDSEKKNPSSSNRSRTYDLLVTSPDAQAKAIKLGSCVKRPAYCYMSIGGILAMIQM